MSSGEQTSPDVAPPGTGARPRRGAWVRYLRLGAMIAVIVLAIVAGATVVSASLDPTENKLRQRAGLFGKSELRIGVGFDRPGLGYLNPNGKYGGFEIEIAYLIAEDLGFQRKQVKFLTVVTENRRRMRGGDGIPVDLVVASYSITPERERLPEVMFSVPYLSTELAVVTREHHPQVDSLGQLKGKRVCTLESGTAVGWAEKSGLIDNLTKRGIITSCIEDLRTGTYDAVVSDATILAGWVARYGDELRHHDIATDEEQNYGVNVGNNESLRELVNLALYCSLHDPEDSRWEDAYRRHLEPLQAANKDQLVAETDQPNIPPEQEPRVRRLPWEYWVPESWPYGGRPARCH